MKKRLRFFYRYISRSRRLRQIFTLQTMMVLVVAAAVIAVLSATTANEATNQTLAAAATLQTVTPDPAAGPTRTPLPEEYINNSQVTIGITLGAAVLVLIVVFGVVTYMPKPTE
jgi:hypothetical protein